MISRGFEKEQNKKETTYLKDNHKIEDEVHFTPTSSSTYNDNNDIQLDPNLSDEDIMKEFG